MSYGYLGDTSTKIKQVKKNDGIITASDVVDLTSKGHLGGSLKLIATASHSGDVNTIDFTSIKETEFDFHYMQIRRFGFESGIGRIGVQLREAGTWETAGVYDYAIEYLESTGAEGEQKQQDYEYMQLEYQNSAVGEFNANVYLYGLGNGSNYSVMNYNLFMNSSGYSSYRFGGGSLPQASVIDGIRIMRSGSNDFTSYEIKLYGYKQL